jgi:uncharacterized protein YqeY
MLIDKLREDLLNARRARTAISTGLLTALVGEAVMVGKNAGNRDTNDEEVLATIRKFLKNAEENLVRLVSIGRPIDETNVEIAILKAYLPQQMSEMQLAVAIMDLKLANPSINMGQMMKSLKDKYAGLYDSRRASDLVKAALI